MVTRTCSGPRTNWRSRMSGLVVVMVAPPVGIVGIDPSLAGTAPGVVGPGRAAVVDPRTVTYPGLDALPMVLRYSSGGTP
jgi:hypothetical protein